MEKKFVALAILLLFFLASAQSTHAVKVAVYGDSRFPWWDILRTSKVHQNIADQIRQHNPDLVINTGDIISGALKHDEMRKVCSTLSGIKQYYLALGNHDAAAQSVYEDLKGSGECNAEINFLRGSGWEEIVLDNVHFFILNSNVSFAQGSPQLTWLGQRLAAVPQGDFKFVVLHKPIVSIGVKSKAMDPSEKSALKIVLDAYSVPAVFSGHDHAFSWCSQVKTLYIVTGGGGAELRDIGNPSYVSGCIRAEKVNHWLLLETKGNTATIDIYYADGTKGPRIADIKISGYAGACNPETIEVYCEQASKVSGGACDSYEMACLRLSTARERIRDIGEKSPELKPEMDKHAATLEGANPTDPESMAEASEAIDAAIAAAERDAPLPLEPEEPPKTEEFLERINNATTGDELRQILDELNAARDSMPPEEHEIAINAAEEKLAELEKEETMLEILKVNGKDLTAGAVIKSIVLENPVNIELLFGNLRPEKKIILVYKGMPGNESRPMCYAQSFESSTITLSSLTLGDSEETMESIPIRKIEGKVKFCAFESDYSIEVAEPCKPEAGMEEPKRETCLIGVKNPIFEILFERTPEEPGISILEALTGLNEILVQDLFPEIYTEN